MNSAELVYALQCCAPQSKNDRDCSACPFSSSYRCHTELCEQLIDYIVNEHGRAERLSAYIDTITSDIHNIRDALR